MFSLQLFVIIFLSSLRAGGGDHGPGGGSVGAGGAGTSGTKPPDEELLNVRDVVELLRDFLRAKALTESEISREVSYVFVCV